MNDRLSDLAARIAECESMTETLRQWCEEFRIGHGPLRSDRAPDFGITPPSDHAIRHLALSAGETAKHRGILLMRGDARLLEADNWYVPQRLPEESNRLLEETDTPFGAAVPGEGQARETLFIDVRELKPKAAELLPIIIVRAVVTLKRVPVSFVEERLTQELLGTRYASG